MKYALLNAGRSPAPVLAMVLAAAPLAAQEVPPITVEPTATATATAPDTVAPVADEQVDLSAASEPAEEFTFLSEEEEEFAEFEAEMTAAFGMLGELFKVEPLTPEQEARLPQAQEMALAILPDGAFGTAMNGSIEPMLAMMMGDLGNDPRTRLAELSGVPTDELAALDDPAAQEALDIFDPQYAERNQRTKGLVVTMLGKLLTAVEPAYRDALAKALAVRFEPDEMRELIAFFATPVGAKFAQQSFQVQYDPRMMGVMEAMGPAFAKILPELMEEVVAIESELGAARDFTELSTAERARAAQLIGKSASELEALVPRTYSVEPDEDDVAT